MVWTDASAGSEPGVVAGFGGNWPKKPGSRKLAGDTPCDVLNPLHPALTNVSATRASNQAGFQTNCTST